MGLRRHFAATTLPSTPCSRDSCHASLGYATFSMPRLTWIMELSAAGEPGFISWTTICATSRQRANVGSASRWPVGTSNCGEAGLPVLGGGRRACHIHRPGWLAAKQAVASARPGLLLSAPARPTHLASGGVGCQRQAYRLVKDHLWVFARMGPSWGSTGNVQAI
jgi:hypothetical protein